MQEGNCGSQIWKLGKAKPTPSVHNSELIGAQARVLKENVLVCTPGQSKPA